MIGESAFPRVMGMGLVLPRNSTSFIAWWDWTEVFKGSSSNGPWAQPCMHSFHFPMNGQRAFDSNLAAEGNPFMDGNQRPATMGLLQALGAALHSLTGLPVGSSAFLSPCSDLEALACPTPCPACKTLLQPRIHALPEHLFLIALAWPRMAALPLLAMPQAVVPAEDLNKPAFQAHLSIHQPLWDQFPPGALVSLFFGD